MTPLKTIRRGGMLNKAALLIASSYMGLVFAAGDLPSNYIGKQSFNLQDDPQLSRLISDVRQAKRELDQKQNKVKAFQDRLNKLQNEATKLKDENTRHQSQIDKAAENKRRFEKIIKDTDGQVANLKKQMQADQQKINRATQQKAKLEQQHKSKQAALQKKRQECRATPAPDCQQQMQAMRKEIQAFAQKIKAQQQQVTKLQNAKKQKQNQIAQKEKTKRETQQKLKNLPNTIRNLRQKINANNTAIAQKDQQMNQLRPQVRSARQAAQNAKDQHTRKQDQRQRYRQQLVTRIMQANQNGAQEGMQDGRFDGRSYADRVGQSEGDKDGQYDGDVQGSSDGRDRDYNEGRRTGYQNGVDDAFTQGKINGTNDGKYNAHVDAAKSDGKAAGNASAKASDAPQVGTEQGKKAGMARAISTGKSRGRTQGERKAIENAESVQLTPVEVMGPFAGAFSRNIPDFPNRFRGRSFDPSAPRARREVVKKAFADGYKYRYSNAAENTFERNIDSIYNKNYDSSYDSSYRMAYNDFYQADYQRGLNQGEDQGYKATYPRAYQDSYDAQYADSILNPDTNSGEYQSQYATSKSAEYAKVYEAIRKNYFDQFEQSEFQANIQAQTQKFRAQRRQAVMAIYQAAPVLKFESSTLKDIGTRGVGANDGITMPGEDLALDVVITNYGQKAADNVVINAGQGQMKLPSIPALSQVTVRGAAKSQVTVGENQTQTIAYTVSSPLTHEMKIQGRHFAQAQNAVMATGAHQLTAKYPLTVSGMSLAKTLLLDDPAKLSVNVLNLSNNKNMKGPIQVEMEDTSRSNVIVSQFADIQLLANSTTLNDAVVLVADESDAYTPIQVNVRLTKNGVLLGKMKRPFTMAAKAPYQDKGANIVIVADSEQNPQQLLDVLAQTGGIRKSEVLDLSLKSANAPVLNRGFQKKTLVVLDHGVGKMFQKIDGLLSKSKNLSLLTVDNPNFESALRTAQTFKGADAFDIKLHGYNAQKVLVSNPFIAANHASSFTAANTSFNQLAAMAKLFAHSQKTSDEFIAEAKAMVNPTNFYKPSVAQFHMLQFFNLRMLQEVLVVNQAYRHFNEASKYKDMIKGDKNMFHNKLIRLVKSVDANNVGLALVAYDASIMLKKATRHYRPIEDKMKSDIKGKLWGAFFSSGAMKDYPNIPSYVRKHDRSLSTKMQKYQNVYSALDLTGVSLPNL